MTETTSIVISVLAVILSVTAAVASWRQKKHDAATIAVLRTRNRELEETIGQVRMVIHLVSDGDPTEWERGFHSCAQRVLHELGPGRHDAAQTAPAKENHA